MNVTQVQLLAIHDQIASDPAEAMKMIADLIASDEVTNIEPKSLLTPTQREIFNWMLEQHHIQTVPTLREIAHHFGINSSNGVINHLKALAKKGLIAREPNKPRMIRFLRMNPVTRDDGTNKRLMRGART